MVPRILARKLKDRCEIPKKIRVWMCVDQVTRSSHCRVDQVKSHRHVDVGCHILLPHYLISLFSCFITYAIKHHMPDIQFTPINSKMSAATNATTASPAVDTNSSANTTNRVLPERWTEGKPFTAQYYYDEPLPDSQDTLPPNDVDLSDVWVVHVLKANVRPVDRTKRWPAVFSSKYLANQYQNKGPASKRNDQQGWAYDVVFGTYEMHGTEGREAGYNRNMRRVKTSTCHISKGRMCGLHGTQPELPDQPELPEKRKQQPTEQEGSNKRPRIPGQASRQTIPKSTSSELSSSGQISSGLSIGHKASGPTTTANQASSDQTTGLSSVSMTFDAPKALDSTDDEEEDLRKINKDLKNKVGDWQKRYYRMTAEGKKQNADFERDLKVAKTQSTMLAETMAEIHGSIAPLIAHTYEAAVLLKKLSKGKPEADAETVKKFYQGNTAKVEGWIEPANKAIKKMIKESPKLSKLLFNHDGKSQDGLREWIKEMTDNQVPSPKQSSST